EHVPKVSKDMEEKFIAAFIQCYFIALGVIIGGAIIGSIGSFSTGAAPLSSIVCIASGLRIWAIVDAIDATFDAINAVLDGTKVDLFKQILLIISAMGGVKTAIVLIDWFFQEDTI